MNKFHLPKLIKITIKDYTLYKEPIYLDFNKKLNIIYGTNGIGKSTLLEIIIFSLIGPYKDNIKVKTYQNEKKINRPIVDEFYFKDRMPVPNENASVTAEFLINEDFYQVKHSLYNNKLIEVYKNNEKLDGEQILYKTYEKNYSYKSNNIQQDNSILEKYLINKYHEELEKSTKMPDGINSLISMMMEVIFFSEARKYTFWDADLQELILGKYIIDLQAYINFDNKKRDTKYLESMYKKRSEELNYYKKIIQNDKEKTQQKNNTLQFIDEKIENNKKLEKAKETIKILKAEYDSEKTKYISLRKEIEQKENNVKNLSKEWYDHLLPNNYNLHYRKFENDILKGICPLCGKKHRFLVKTDSCIFCSQKLDINSENLVNLLDIDIARKNEDLKLQQLTNEFNLIQNRINEIQREIKELNKEIEKLNFIANEQIINSENDKDKTRINQLIDNINKADEIYKKSQKEEYEMKVEINENMLENFNKFSKIFKKYSNSFFGNENKTELTLPESDEDDKENNLLMQFSLNDKPRNFSHMLSESQRIFTDLSFRFTILENFHDFSFFMCETPDSTLDKQHEDNAVDTFSNYIKSNNILFLTANAKQSSLIMKLYQAFKNDSNLIDLTKLSALYSYQPEAISIEKYLGDDNE